MKTVAIPEDIHTRLKKASDRTGLRLTWIIKSACKAWLKEDDEIAAQLEHGRKKRGVV